jgi:hypothetical protein
MRDEITPASALLSETFLSHAVFRNVHSEGDGVMRTVPTLASVAIALALGACTYVERTPSPTVVQVPTPAPTVVAPAPAPAATVTVRP